MSWDRKPFTTDESLQDRARYTWDKHVDVILKQQAATFAANGMTRAECRQWEERRAVQTSRANYGMKGVNGYVAGKQAK